MKSKTQDNMWDVIIVGAGAAGLTAGMYTARRALSTLILSRDLGGQASLTDWIENYPGVVGKTHGAEIMENFRRQYEEFGGKIRFEEVKKVEKLPDGNFRVVTPQGEEQAQAVILAFGLTPRELKVPGEERLKGKGVTYCATCDGPLYKGKTVGVVGSITEALDAAEYLSKICPKVYLFPQRDKLLGSATLNEKVKGIANIEIFWNKKIVEVVGEEKVTGVKWQSINAVTGPSTPQYTSTGSVTTGQASSGASTSSATKYSLSGAEAESKGREIGETKLDGLFIEIGYIAKTDWVKDFVELDAKRQIKVDKENRTSVPGIYAAGDITDVDYKQVVVSAGEGAKAALETYKYLQAKAGKSAVLTPDWGGR